MVIPHPTDLPPANLYLEEIQKINRILLKHSQSVSFMIDENDAGYAFASLDEMLSEPPSTTPRQMSIHAYPISISIHISSKYIWISYDSNDAVILGIVEQIRQIFRQNTSWFQKWRYSLGYVYITTLLIATICRFSLFTSTNLLLDFIISGHDIHRNKLVIISAPVCHTIQNYPSDTKKALSSPR